MRSKIIAGWAVLLAELVLSGPLSAHHAAIMFDTTTPIRIKGTVIRYIWANPHSAREPGLSHGNLESGQHESGTYLAGRCRQGHHGKAAADEGWSQGTLVALWPPGTVYQVRKPEMQAGDARFGTRQDVRCA
jgi:hypothetical protein